MTTDIKSFLESDLLVKYMVGETNFDDTQKVEALIKAHPEVKEAYNTLQLQLELKSQVEAIKVPETNNLYSILDAINETPVVNLNPKPNKSWKTISIAASVVALISLISTFFLYNYNLKLVNENQVVVDEIFDLRSDISQNNKKLDALTEQFLQLNNPETQKYVFKRNNNKRSKNLKTVAYINPKERTSLIDVVSLPILPKEQEYLIWADIEGKMVNLGILEEADRKLKPIPYAEDALGLHITIENKNEDHKTYKGNNAVAEVSLRGN